MSITDVALACGFQNSQYLATMFRQKTGRPPRAWHEGADRVRHPNRFNARDLLDAPLKTTLGLTLQIRDADQRSLARLQPSSFMSAGRGNVLTTSPFVSQPLRAMPAPRRRKPACSNRCASQLMTHFTPLDLA